MSASPLDAFQSVLQDEVTRQTELRVKETMAELLGGIAREFGLAVVPMVETVKPTTMRRVELTPATEALLDFTAFDKAVKRYKRNVNKGKRVTAAGRKATVDVIREGNILVNEFGVSRRALSARAGRSVNWFAHLMHIKAEVINLHIVK